MQGDDTFPEASVHKPLPSGSRTGVSRSAVKELPFLDKLQRPRVVACVHPGWSCQGIYPFLGLVVVTVI